MIRRLLGYYQTAVTDLRFQSKVVLFWRAVVKVFSPVVRFDLQILYELDLTQPIAQRPARIECTIGRATEADLDEMLDMQMATSPPALAGELTDEEELQYAQLARVRASAYETFLRTMRAGEHCYVARVEGRIAHSNWVRYHDCGPVDGRGVDLMPGEVYTTDGFTADRWRGMRLHEAVLTHMLRVAQARGCHRAYTITDLTKAASRRGLRRVGGWSKRGQILYITPRGLRRTWLLRLGGDLEPMFRHARSMMAVRQ